MKIARLSFNPLQVNTYILWDETLEAVVIDAAASNERENEILDKFIADHGLKVIRAVNTHGHFDHLMGVSHVCEKYGVGLALSAKDKFLLENAASSAMMFGIRMGGVPQSIELDLSEVESITFGNTELKVIPTPGHTPGHVVLYAPEAKVLFTGDTLFRESIGRTDLPGGDYSWIMRSILEQIMPLGDDVKIYPGHGEMSDIGHESMYNPFVVEVINNEVNYKN